VQIPQSLLSAQTLLNGLVGIRGPLTFVSHREEFIYSHVMVGMALLAIALPILSLLRPNPPKSVMSQNEEDELRALLKTHAEDSIGYFAFRRDKSVIWSTTRKAAIAYRVVGSCAIASGDPIGNPDAWPLVIHDFLLLCKRNGWTPAAAGVSELGGEIWVRESEMAALEIGDEAVVIVNDYEIESPRYRNVRQTVRKIQKLNYRTEIFRSADLRPELRHLLEADAMKWRKVDTERGFMMGLGRIAEPNESDLLTRYRL
jgi:lysyl-tRNA synthetase class 2